VSDILEGFGGVLAGDVEKDLLATAVRLLVGLVHTTTGSAVDAGNK
jgi:hypothetical protein